MSKLLKRSLIALVVLVVVAFGVLRYMRIQTKKASPEETVTFVLDDFHIAIDYSRPSKKGRAIFGGLVPYGKVWRTGANEATTFTVNKAITFGGASVAPGTYTLWTIPGPDQWTVVLNSKMYGWGIDFDGNAQRDPQADVAKANVPVTSLTEPVEQFTIEVVKDPTALTLKWDNVAVSVPLGQ